jgi:hypothetical protein
MHVFGVLGFVLIQRVVLENVIMISMHNYVVRGGTRDVVMIVLVYVMVLELWMPVEYVVVIIIKMVVIVLVPMQMIVCVCGGDNWCSTSCYDVGQSCGNQSSQHTTKVPEDWLPHDWPTS